MLCPPWDEAQKDYTGESGEVWGQREVWYGEYKFKGAEALVAMDEKEFNN